MTRPPSRREFLGSLGIGAGALAVGCAARRTGPPQTSATANQPPPHFFVFFNLQGGYDAVMTFDPKTAAEAGDKLDRCYGDDDRVRAPNGRMFGPLIGGLAAHAADLCIVHGVRFDSVAHPDCQSELYDGRIAVGSGSEGVWNALAYKRPGTCDLPFVVLPWRPSGGKLIPGGGLVHATPDRHWSPMTNVDPALTQGMKPPRWFAKMSEDQGAIASGFLKPDELKDYREKLRLSERFHDWVTNVPKLDFDFGNDWISPSFPLVIEGMKRGTARLFYVFHPILYFDTHSHNEREQRRKVVSAFDAIGKFVTALKSTKTPHGSLFEQTTIVIGTEIGRFPKLNSDDGKDHWPENSFALLGKRVRPGTIGGTGPDYRGIEIDYRTGTATGSERRPIPLDAFSSTLLRIAGMTPSKWGFRDDEVIEAAIAG